MVKPPVQHSTTSDTLLYFLKPLPAPGSVQPRTPRTLSASCVAASTVSSSLVRPDSWLDVLAKSCRSERSYATSSFRYSIMLLADESSPRVALSCSVRPLQSAVTS